jgi:hypothetical protein
VRCSGILIAARLMAAMIIIIWYWQAHKSAVALPYCTESCFPRLISELVEISDNTINPDLPLEGIYFRSFFWRELNRFDRRQRNRFASFHDIPYAYYLAVDRSRAKFGDANCTRAELLADNCFDAERSKLQWRLAHVFYNNDRPISSLWSDFCYVRARYIGGFDGEPGPCENGRFDGDHRAQLRQRGVSRIASRSCGPSCLSYGCPHITFLPISNVSREIDRFAQGVGLHAENDGLSYQSQKLQNANASESAGKSNQPPIGRRLITSVCCLLSAFFCCLLGGKYFYNNRPIFGATLLGIGWLLGSGGFFVVAFGVP